MDSMFLFIKNNKFRFIPHQWFYIAAYYFSYVVEMEKYKVLFNKIFKQFNKEPKISKQKQLEPSTVEKYMSEIDKVVSSDDKKIFIKFLTDPSWHRANKYLDRSDLVSSALFNLAGITHADGATFSLISNFLNANQRGIELLRLEKKLSQCICYLCRKPDECKRKNLIVYKAPGTGKSYYLKNNFSNIIKTVFHSEYSNADFVGSVGPTMDYSEDKPKVMYDLIPGPFALAIKKSTITPTQPVTLLIEKINRGDTSNIFGEILQLLERNNEGRSEYPVSVSLPFEK
ncbi:5-methylcytosine-specific restriction endonuclease subunit McrB [Candidatus Enterovibrio altilux]|uniref:hypothetical protein n=1 Tax=Candidatus Enterovibrio altilux TaxID=1927128 RepID=UPI00125D1788|nr:hypothetical protein [Candidatus Enterovibrio luxaltus]